MGANLFGFDPALMVKDPTPPPPPPPDKPKVSLALTAADLAMPEVRQILQELGIALGATVSPELALAHAQQQAKDQPHGGTADRVETLSQHHGELTGAMPGQVPAGAPPASATPGRVQ